MGVHRRKLGPSAASDESTSSKEVTSGKRVSASLNRGRKTKDGATTNDNKNSHWIIASSLVAVAIGSCYYYYVTNESRFSLFGGNHGSSSRETLSIEEESDFHEDKKPTHTSCRLYLAPSSVNGIDGFGIFTVEDIPAMQTFFNAPDGPSIVVTDYDQGLLYLSEQRSVFMQTFDNYWWGRGNPDQVLYESENNMDFQITLGSLPNHHCILHSIDAVFAPYKDDLLDTESPGLGASSYHMGRDFFPMVRAS